MHHHYNIYMYAIIYYFNGEGENDNYISILEGE